jgi:hypothetical protein
LRLSSPIFSCVGLLLFSNSTIAKKLILFALSVLSLETRVGANFILWAPGALTFGDPFELS